MSSDGSGDEEGGEPWVPYSERPEWRDVAPVPQDDGPHAVVRIAYPREFTDTMDYFRAVLFADEMSDRALEVTSDAIRLNAGNYTAWHFRRKLVRALKRDLREELEYIDDVSMENPKNYQIWFHRRAIVDELGDGSRELEFTASKLADDAKNYHAWAHRQWAIRRFGLWENELQFCHDLLQDDHRNNSAWNQRFFVLTRGGEVASLPQEVRGQEIQYGFNWIARDPTNESPWSYVRGMVQHGGEYRFSDFPIVRQGCLDWRGRDRRCAHAMSLLLDVLEEDLESAPAGPERDGAARAALGVLEELIAEDGQAPPAAELERRGERDVDPDPEPREARRDRPKGGRHLGAVSFDLIDFGPSSPGPGPSPSAAAAPLTARRRPPPRSATLPPVRRAQPSPIRARPSRPPRMRRRGARGPAPAPPAPAPAPAALAAAAGPRGAVGARAGGRDREDRSSRRISLEGHEEAARAMGERLRRIALAQETRFAPLREELDDEGAEGDAAMEASGAVGARSWDQARPAPAPQPPRLC
eukprot:tig00020943_g16312.t1